MDAKALAVVVEPAAQAGPFPDERLMGQLDVRLAHRHQAGVHQSVKDRRQALGLVRSRRELGHGDASTRVHSALAELGQADEDVAGQGLLRGIELPVDGLCGAGYGTAHAPGGGVPLVGEHPPAPPLPRLEEGMRQQRQRPRLIGQVTQDDLGEAGLEAEARDPGRPVDGRGHLRPGHRAQQGGAGLEQVRELGVGGAVTEEVGADGEHHGRDAAGHRRRVDERVDELPALVLVAAQREQLLELVDHDHDPRLRGQRCGRLAGGQIERPGLAAQVVEQRAHRCGRAQRQVRSELRQRVRTRAHQHRGPCRAVRQRVVAQRGHDAGAHQRRLPGAGRTDHGEQPRRRQAIDERGHHRVAAEEQPAVLRLEGDKALVGRLGLGTRFGLDLRQLADDLDRGDRLRQSLQRDRSGIGEREPAAGPDELAHEVGGDDLAGHRGITEASSDDDGSPEVVVLVVHGLPDMQPDPDVQGVGRRPVALLDGALHLQCARNGIGARGERHHEPVTEVLDLPTVVGRHGVSHLPDVRSSPLVGRLVAEAIQ